MGNIDARFAFLSICRCCRDCANFEERRDIDGIALCMMHEGPLMCCPEFRPRKKKTDKENYCDMFCLNCLYFENIDGISICSKHQRPVVACSAFKARKNE
jgi:hypothetical protein